MQKPVEQVAVPEATQPPVQELLVDGLNLAFIGTHNADVIQKRLEKFIALLEDEPEEFYIELKIMQKQPKK